MEKTTIAILVSVVAVVIALIGSFGSDSQTLGGAACNGGNCTDYDAVNTSAGYYVDDSQIINGSGAFIGASISQTTSNTATSTAIMGCIQTYATSTATAIRFTLSPYAGTTTTQGGNSNFLVAAQYGTCPI